MWSGQWPGPEPAGLGRAWASTMTIVLRAGPGLDILFAGRAGPGPHNSVCGPGPGRVCTTAAGPAWASNHICGPGLGLNFRPVQGPSVCLALWQKGQEESIGHSITHLEPLGGKEKPKGRTTNVAGNGRRAWMEGLEPPVNVSQEK